jgi:MscS family membrane protein
LIGLAASLAAQDTLKNFFGTLLLIGEHPFRIGEHISVQGVEGLVESVGFRSTRLRTFDDSLLTVPNSVMAAALIDNRGARTSRRLRTVVSLAYGTPIDKIVALRDALRKFAASQPRFLPGKIEVHIGGLGATSLELFVQVYFRVATYTDELVCRDALSRAILEEAERLGVALAGSSKPASPASSGSDAHAVPPPPKHLLRKSAETARLEHSLPADGEPRSERGSSS